jgi:drug/metabolite transporter (DMT)-like permease
VDPAIIGLVAISAVLHVAWNIRLKSAGDPLITATINLAVGAVIIVPIGTLAWLADGAPTLPPEGIALGLVSSVFEAAYFILLAGAYRRGDLSVVYPIARGTAPLLLVAIGVVVLGERLGGAGWIGVGALIVGFLALRRPWLALRTTGGARRPDTAILFALATGVAIAGYTSVDRVGTRLIEPVTYAAINWLGGTILLVARIALVRRGEAVRPDRALVREASFGGVMMLGAYLLILIALSVAPLTAVAPLRESATVVAAAWGAVRMGEAVGRGEAVRRIGASALIVAGAVLLALDG